MQGGTHYLSIGCKSQCRLKGSGCVLLIYYFEAILNDLDNIIIVFRGLIGRIIEIINNLIGGSKRHIYNVIKTTIYGLGLIFKAFRIPRINILIYIILIYIIFRSLIIILEYLSFVILLVTYNVVFLLNLFYYKVNRLFFYLFWIRFYIINVKKTILFEYMLS